MEVFQLIKLKLDNIYKSLNPFEIELPDFVILTGVNGSGKTHILTAIHEHKLIATSDEKSIIRKIYTNYETLKPNDSNQITKELLKTEQANLMTVINKAKNPRAPRFNIGAGEYHWIDSLTSSQRNAVKHISEYSGKSCDEITQEDVDNHYPAVTTDVNDIFNHNLSAIFKRYADIKEKNNYFEYKNRSHNENNAVLNDSEFEGKYGIPPWDLMNDILSDSNLPYKLTFPSHQNPYDEKPFQTKLINEITNSEVNFSDLSSGEKTLMCLALAMYNSEKEMGFPDLILMDEPDASLHPSMAKQFLNIIQDVFVKKHNVKIIMVSHSPSTVALAPEDSIYVVAKESSGGEKIKKSSKDTALKILTAGVPSFSINYENRRQIFVESRYDVEYYEQLYNKLSPKLNPEISLNFISSGDSRTDKNGDPVANCEQVKQIVQTLRKSGNKFIFGVIDWDNTNRNDEGIFVLGYEKRYSIENYIFDPLLVVAFLLRSKFIKATDAGLSTDESYLNLSTLTNDSLQKVVDFIITKMGGDQNNKVNVAYINGKTIQVPNWYLTIQGHELEKKLKDSFPELKRYNKESALKNEILRTVVDDHPGLIPKDLYDLFVNLQDN